MKNLKYTFILAIAFSFLTVNAQEKKIKFNKGTLNICSTKNFIIEGYDGDEVIIKSLHEKSTNRRAFTKVVGKARGIKNSNKNANWKVGYSFDKVSFNDDKKDMTKYGLKKDTMKPSVSYFTFNDFNRKKGLKKLGKNNENEELGIYFTIELKGNELTFRDSSDGQLIMSSNEHYKIKLPNSLKLNWETNSCKKKKEDNRKYIFFNSKASSLSNFDGEVEISTSLNNIKLKDVTGPVSINTIGGNVTIEFNKKTPKKLYSIYSNNGFIDITLPTNSSINVDATASDIFSDIDFKVQDEKEVEGLQKMKLKLKSGNVKMKLNAGLGNIYLRKK